MTEAPVAETETETAAPKTGRGRPRPENTVQRDEAVLAKLREAGAEGMTRDQLAEKLAVQSSHAYLSLFRLHRDGLVRRSAGGAVGTSHRWFAVAEGEATGQPDEAPAEAPVEQPTG